MRATAFVSCLLVFQGIAQTLRHASAHVKQLSLVLCLCMSRRLSVALMSGRELDIVGHSLQQQTRC